MTLTRREFTVLAASAAATQVFPALAAAKNASSTAPDLTGLSLTEAAAKVRSGAVTATQLTEACLARIAVYDSKLDAFITVAKDKALARARQLDADFKAGHWHGPLHGVPIAIKDNIDTAGIRTTGASAVFEDRVPAEDATVITRLIAAGAIVIGKTNAEEFAMGYGESSFFAPTRNPWNLAHGSGGSSSGSGAAIAACLSYGALGTDTAGSVRMPASYCGIVGLKPTYGLVPIRGIIPLALSADHCGPMTRTVEDNALMLGVMAGYDKLDITSVEHAKEDYVAALDQPISGLRLGTPIGYFDNVHPEITAAVAAATDQLAQLTSGGVKEISLPAIAHLGILNMLEEVFAYHEEYFKSAGEMYMLSHRRLLGGLAAAKPKAAEYIRSKWQLELLRRTVDDAFAECDVVVLPTQRILPPRLAELIEQAHDTQPREPSVTTNCWPFNAFGIPAISIPCGFSKNGLPIGLMIAGPRFSEGRVLAVARAYERATEWHTRRPPIAPTTPVPPIVVDRLTEKR